MTTREKIDFSFKIHRWDFDDLKTKYELAQVWIDNHKDDPRVLELSVKCRMIEQLWIREIEEEFTKKGQST